MLARYRLEPDLSRLTIQAFAAGMLSFMGHNPTFLAPAFSGEVHFDPATVGDFSLTMSVATPSLQLLDNVGPGDRADIEGRMRHEVLQVEHYPEMRFVCSGHSPRQIGPPGKYRMVIRGQLTLRGMARPLEVEGQLTLFEDGIYLHSEFLLRQSVFGIQPVSALGGALRLKDELVVSVALAARKESQP